MNEASEQAVQLGANVTIFIIALTISITLMMGVRDVAEKAFSYNSSLPNGSRVISTESQNRHIIKGYELLSYYANHMTDANYARSGKYEITIENSAGKKITAIELENKTIKQFFRDNGIDLSKDYEVITEEYNKEEEILYITLKEI